MYVLTYRTTNGPSLRGSFTLRNTDLALAGNIYERSDPQKLQDRYYWSFGGKFQWEVGDTLPPFTAYYKDKNVSSDLFFGVPQVVLKLMFDFEPQIASKYKTGEYRTCKNCTYLQFNQASWEEYKERPISERFEAAPSFYSCQVTGQQLDRRSQLRTASNALRESQEQVANNTCSAQTRSAYKTELSLEARKLNTNPNNKTERWISAEHRRLHCLNPEVISYQDQRVILAGIPILLKKPI